MAFVSSWYSETISKSFNKVSHILLKPEKDTAQQNYRLVSPFIKKEILNEILNWNALAWYKTLHHE